MMGNLTDAKNRFPLLKPCSLMKNGYPRYPDMVLDGTVLEIKSVSGTIKTLGLEFKRGYKQGQSLLETNLPENYPPQGHSVFIQLASNMKVEAVKAKIAGELKNRMDEGSFICFFEQSGELYSWTYTELRAIIRKSKKIPGLYVAGVTAKEAIRTFSPPPPPPVAASIMEGSFSGTLIIYHFWC